MNEGLENKFLIIESQVGLKRQAIVLQRNQVQVVLESQASGIFKVGKPNTVLNRTPQTL
jgi:general secretion pathway protein H